MLVTDEDTDTIEDDVVTAASPTYPIACVGPDDTLTTGSALEHDSSLRKCKGLTAETDETDRAPAMALVTTDTTAAHAEEGPTEAEAVVT